jgi:sirohydrochlorin cobaltochelatase
MIPNATSAIIVIGHGSLRSASGAAMIRIAARLRGRGLADQAEAAFLNYSRPTLAETVAKCSGKENGASPLSILIAPYFLIGGAYVQNDLTALVRRVAADHPNLRFQMAEPLGDHPRMVALARRRVQEALASRPTAPDKTDTHLLLMAHGTPLEEANAPLARIAEQVRRGLGLASATLAYLDCNAPTIPDAFAHLAASGARRIVAMPYFLHLGRHVAEDLPALIAAAQAAHPATEIVAAHHLDYDLALVDVVADRARAALRASVSQTVVDAASPVPFPVHKERAL